MLKRKLLICGTVAAVIVSPAAAGLLFDDDFASDPASNGWIESPDGGDIVSDGDIATFSGPGGSTQAITQNISTAGSSDLFVGFKATATDSAESNDTLTFLIDSDNDGVFEAVTSANAGGANLENADFTALPAAAHGKSSLPIRVTWNHNFDDEDLLLDRLVIFPAGEIIETDPFDLDPADNGWTESGSVGSNGEQALLGGDPASSITKTFDLTGYTNILVNLEGINDTYNGLDDMVTVEVDAGDGFVEVGRQLGTDSPYLLGALLPPEADDNAGVTLRLTADSSYSGQDTKFDNLTLRGALIPEPASLTLLAVGGLLGLRRTIHRRRWRGARMPSSHASHV